MYSGRTLFVDHGSGLIRNFNQVGLGAPDTIHSKENFELEAKGMSVTVHSYYADNGIYKSKEFQKDLDKGHQILTLYGVGAHVKNGVAKRTVQTMVNSAKTMMLHQALMGLNSLTCGCGHFQWTMQPIFGIICLVDQEKYHQWRYFLVLGVIVCH